jgi:hypothetical protein
MTINILLCTLNHLWIIYHTKYIVHAMEMLYCIYMVILYCLGNNDKNKVCIQ